VLPCLILSRSRALLLLIAVVGGQHGRAFFRTRPSRRCHWYGGVSTKIVYDIYDCIIIIIKVDLVILRDRSSLSYDFYLEDLV